MDAEGRLVVGDSAQLRDWLMANHDCADGVWLVLYKKHCGDRHVPVGEVVRECLCFGWIDSMSRGLDADRTQLRIGPRKPGGTWSAVNKRHIAELLAAGRIHPAGQRVIDAAKADGSWTFLDDVEALVVPEDLAAALAGAGLEPAWAASTRSSRKQALFAVKSAKRLPTREKRIAGIVERLAAGSAPA